MHTLSSNVKESNEEIDDYSEHLSLNGGTPRSDAGRTATGISTLDGDRDPSSIKLQGVIVEPNSNDDQNFLHPLPHYMDEDDFSSSPIRPYVILLAFFACLNSCNLGYDTGAMGGAALTMQDEMGWSDNQTEIYIGCVNILAIFGSLLASPLCDWLGRRRAFFNSSIMFLIGMTGTTFSNNYVTALFFRIFIGLAVGLGLAIDPLYISEISPKQHRGRLVAFSEIAINFGILLGYIANYVFYKYFHNNDGADWRSVVGLGMIIPSIIIYLTLSGTLPESPRWLIGQNRLEEAKEILVRTYPDGTDIDKVVQIIKEDINYIKETELPGWGPIFCPSSAVKLMLLAGVGLAASQQINGEEAFIYYSPKILEQAGFESRDKNFLMTVVIGCVKLIFIFIAAFTSDDAGRRPLLLFSIAGMTACLVSLSFTIQNQKLSAITVTIMCCYMAFFSIGSGPLTWLGVSEVFPTVIRAKAMSLATSVNRLVAALVTMTQMTLTNLMGSRYYFIMFGIFAFISGIYIYIFFPETKGRSLEEITVFFEEQAEKLEKEKMNKKRKNRFDNNNHSESYHNTNTSDDNARDESLSN